MCEIRFCPSKQVGVLKSPCVGCESSPTAPRWVTDMEFLGCRDACWVEVLIVVFGERQCCLPLTESLPEPWDHRSMHVLGQCGALHILGHNDMCYREAGKCFNCLHGWLSVSQRDIRDEIWLIFLSILSKDEIGRINLKWVTTFMQHLETEQPKRQNFR